MEHDIRTILEDVKTGTLSTEEAVLLLKQKPFVDTGYVDIGYAKVDLHRRVRQGAPEVIYGAGKTPEQILGIMKTMCDGGEGRILITRLSPDSAEIIKQSYPITYHPDARIGILGDLPTPDGLGSIVIATGGTSDVPVAEEAALTAEYLGNAVTRVYDVGVAGLHRLLSHSAEIMQASVIIAIAGMEGALASVIGGLADCPVIAVPTSVGYGASFQGLSALLSMLNSCASGVTVVNIDNGFGAAYTASMINHMRSGLR
ncbi:MAG: nickel pincer cofactor biosynthesis protein LarB [Eubacterium sp.]|nr:nickel pincer cofactor biosynthesis protein LarB [Eubacterium sp.]